MSKPNNTTAPQKSSPSEQDPKKEPIVETTIPTPAPTPEEKTGNDEPSKSEAPTEKKVLLVSGGGWELAFSIADLLNGEQVKVEMIENQILSHKFHKTIPEALVNATVPHGVIVNYVRQILADGIDPSTVWFVVADPATDETLKSINLMRRMIGQAPTFFYPSFDAGKHLPAEGN